MFPSDLGSVSVSRSDFALKAIAVARQFDVPAILKRALYDATRLENPLRRAAEMDLEHEL